MQCGDHDETLLLEGGGQGGGGMMTTPFTHKMAAHCESGAVTALLRGAGMDVTESLVFGISGALFFGYLSVPMLPFPTIALRNKPGRIRLKTPKRLGVTLRTLTFRDPAAATRELDALIARGIPVGAQVDYFYMDYLPEYTRAHFNAHYVIVTGKKDGRYLISDTYFPSMASLDAATLADGAVRARPVRAEGAALLAGVDPRAPRPQGGRAPGDQGRGLLHGQAADPVLRRARHPLLRAQGPGVAEADPGPRPPLPRGHDDRRDPRGARDGRRRLPLPLRDVPAGGGEDPRATPGSPRSPRR